MSLQNVPSNVSSKCLQNASSKSLIKISHQNVSSNRLIKMFHQNALSKCLIKMFHQNISSKWFIKMSHQNVSSQCLYQNVSSKCLIKMLHQTVTGYTSQGGLTCPGRSAGFDLKGQPDFLSAQSHTELILTDLRISDYLNIHCMIFRWATYKKLLPYTLKDNKVGLRQHLNTFRCVWGFVIKSTQRHLAVISVGGINSLATCLGNSATARPALDLEKPVESKQRAINYVYQKGSVSPPIHI